MTLKTICGLAAGLALSGCSLLFGEEEAAPIMTTGVEVAPECPTLWVFSDTTIKDPGEDLPEDWRQFSGVWGLAGWGGYWCHDLYIMEIAKTGEVSLMDVHGPGGKHDGTVFPRTGRITEEGRLTFVADGVRREYWLEDGKLQGRRHARDEPTLSIEMHRKTDA